MRWGRGTVGVAVAAIVSAVGIAVVHAGLTPDAPIHGPAVAGAPASRVAPPARTFSVVAAGDPLTESAVLAAGQREAGPGERYDFGALLAPIAPIVTGADLAICHMELPTGRPGEAPANLGRSAYGGNRLLAPYELAVGVATAGFDRCSTASNHSNDTGTAGIDSTLDDLDAVGLGHAGTARTAEEAAPALFTVNGVRVAHLSYTRFSNTGATAMPWQLRLVATPVPVVDDVRTAREAGAEVVIVSIHTSKEMEREPIPADRLFVEWLTSQAPVDLVIQHGPHVIQPVERVNGTVVYWSVGNLLSGMGVPGTGRYEDQRTLDGLLATARFTEVAPGRFDVEASPLLVCLDPATRIVWPAAGLADPSTPAIVRPVLQACLDRSRQVIPTL